jgi:hypothetical protein
MRKAVGKRRRRKDAKKGGGGRKNKNRERTDPPETGWTTTQSVAAMTTSKGEVTGIKTLQSEEQGRPDKGVGWPAPPGSIMNIQRASSPKSVIEVVRVEEATREVRPKSRAKFGR